MPAPGDGVAELRHRVALAQGHIQALGHGVDDAVQAARGSQVAKPHTAGKVAQPRPAKARHQPCLAGAAQAQHTHQPGAGLHLLRQLGQGRCATHESVALGRQAVRYLAHRQPQFALADDAVGLVGVGRRRKAALAVGQLEQFDRVVQPLQPPMSVRLQAQAVRFTQGAQRRGRQQNLPAQGGGHDTRRGGFGGALDLDRLGSPRHVGGRVLAQRHHAHMHPHPRVQRWLHAGQRALVGQGEVDRLGGGLEHHQHAVGLVDFAPTARGQQVARQAVVLGPHRGNGDIAQLTRQAGAVHDIGQQQGSEFAHGGWSPCSRPPWVKSHAQCGAGTCCAPGLCLPTLPGGARSRPQMPGQGLADPPINNLLRLHTEA